MVVNSSLKKDQKIAWKTALFSERIASVRYRCLMPANMLSTRGVKSFFFQKIDPIDVEKYDVFVFVKTFTNYDFAIAQKAVSLGKAVFLDLCDNIFFESNSGTKKKSKNLQYEKFSEMAKLAAAIFCPTEELKFILHEKFGSELNVIVLPDPVEEFYPTKVSFQDVVRASKFQKFLSLDFVLNFYYLVLLGFKLRPLVIYNRAFLPLIQKSTRLPFLILDKLHALLFKLIFGFLNFLLNKNIVSFHRMNSSSLSGEAHFPIEKSAPILFRRVDVNHLNGVVLSWFGNSGAPHVFGVTDLLLLEKDLVLLKEKISFTLLIVSDRDEQLSYFSHLPIDICFVPWSMDTVRAVLQKSDLVLIPNRRNEFSVCKSANRIVFSIMNNLPVIATTTKANEFFEGDIGRPGNWCELILEVLNNKQSWNSKVISAKQKIETHLSNERLADLWRDSMSLDVTAETAQINSKEHHASYV